MKQFAMMILVTFGALAANAACKEGSTALFKEPANAGRGDYYRTVSRTCVNGSYFDRAGYVYNPAPIKCVEGSTQIFSERDYNQDHSKMVTRTCVNGTFFPKGAPAKKVTCVEGTLTPHSQKDPNSDELVTIVTKCVGGKHVVISKR